MSKKNRKKKQPVGERTLDKPIKARAVKKIRLVRLQVQYQMVTHEEEREGLDDKGEAVLARIPRGPGRMFRIDAERLSAALRNKLLELAEKDVQQFRL